MSSWTQPMCERCWIVRETLYDDNKIVGVRQPTRIAEPDVEFCAFCSNLTIFGIYVRVDPSTVLFPRPDPEEHQQEETR